MEPNFKRASKFLSLVLRHNPGKIGIELDGAGWVGVDDLLEAVRTRGRGVTLGRDKLQEVVDTNDKRRFEFSDDGQRIRARQGHSVDVDLGDEQREPPARLYHGTPEKFVEAIRRDGLLKMSRHAVHLSPDHQTATKVGSRRGRPVIVKVRALDMHADGHEFFLTGNDVWYTEHAPAEYLLWPGEPGYDAA
jgi:putative RNA 2'-phosphotransferase